MWKIYDYLDSRGKSVIQEWADAIRIEKRDRAKLDENVDLLEQHGPDLPPGLLSDTKSKNIKKLRVAGKMAFRPLLCRGPIDNEEEFTFLQGAVERDRKFDPGDAVEKAEKNREEVIRSPSRRREHERLSG